MILLNPKKKKFENLDEKSREIMLKTIEFFENRGLKKLKHDDHERVWYADFLEFQKSVKAFATLMTPEGYGPEDSRWDSYRICEFNEILGFYGLCYWYTWQVSMLGLGPIWLSKNEKLKQKAAKLLEEGEIFAFGLSEKEHGADLISSGMRLIPQGDGSYVAKGEKYYIGNANKAGMVSTFGRVSDSKKYVFFAVDSQHEKYECIRNVTNSQNYVAHYALHDYPIQKEDILSIDREAWDTSLATIAFCKFNLGWASVGIATHAFYEAINHASARRLYNQYVTDFPHIKQLFVDAYTRLVSMKYFSARSIDYMRSASETDRRYLLFNPMVKTKVTMQGEEVVNLIWDVIAAKGFENDNYFETAARDIRGLPKLEGTAHVNMMLITNFMMSYMLNSAEVPDVPRRAGKEDDTFLFNQGATTKGMKTVPFQDYNVAYSSIDVPNVKIFREQIALLKEFLQECPPSKAQTRDIDYMLSLGEMFALIPYGQLIIENAQLDGLEDDALMDQIFDFMVRDFSKFAVQVFSKPSSTEKQMEVCKKMIRKPSVDEDRFMQVWEKHVYALKDQYSMNP
ncbi:MAG: acyl-CoA dehydrogenase [Spirochaetota bacterium]